MACELRGGTPQTDALPTPADWAKMYLEQLSEKNLRIAELEAALRQLLDAAEGAAAHRSDGFIREARAQARNALRKSIDLTNEERGR
jgi:hypothetical protein